MDLCPDGQSNLVIKGLPKPGFKPGVFDYQSTELGIWPEQLPEILFLFIFSIVLLTNDLVINYGKIPNNDDDNLIFLPGSSSKNYFHPILLSQGILVIEKWKERKIFKMDSKKIVLQFFYLCQKLNWFEEEEEIYYKTKMLNLKLVWNKKSFFLWKLHQIIEEKKWRTFTDLQKW